VYILNKNEPTRTYIETPGTKVVVKLSNNTKRGEVWQEFSPLYSQGSSDLFAP